jgi:hypothetical protein
MAKVSFAALGYEQYEDKTPLKLYSKLDHHDKEDAINITKDIARVT